MPSQIAVLSHNPTSQVFPRSSIYPTIPHRIFPRMLFSSHNPTSPLIRKSLLSHTVPHRGLACLAGLGLAASWVASAVKLYCRGGGDSPLTFIPDHHCIPISPFFPRSPFHPTSSFASQITILSSTTVFSRSQSYRTSLFYPRSPLYPKIAVFS